MISKQTIDEILDRADIVDVVKDYVTDVKTKGGKASCCCPFHSERTPSFSAKSSNGLFYCYGCGKGGNVFQFVMGMDNCDFVTAAHKVASKYGIKVEEKEESKEDREKRLKVEAMQLINEQVCELYSSLLWEAENKNALEYIRHRNFKDDYIKSSKFGFAPKGNVLVKLAKDKGLNTEFMMEMGLLGRTDNGKIYDCYQERWVIPIRSKANIVIGFTCRQLPWNDFGGKYVNSKNSDCYDKSKTIFGINAAAKKGIAENVFYLVEGAPDVLRLQSIGVDNAIATLGTAWTKEHFESLKRYNARLCFIPDCDEIKDGERLGTGVKKVMQNGRLAMEMGFEVSVKEILPSDDGEKQDPDSFITSKAVLASIEEKDFILWYFSKLHVGHEEPSAQTKTINDVASLIALVPEKITVDSLISRLSKCMGTKKQWNEAVNNAKKENKEETKSQSKNIDRNILAKYGFYQDDNNSYFSIGEGGKEYQWSNFVMQPLFHIEDNLMPKRLYRIVNVTGIEKIIELKQSELTSLAKFSEKIEGLGNYIWLAKQEQLNKLKMFLYENTETAKEITQLGWQEDGYWAFGNGVALNGKWIDTDEFGIVRLKGIGNVYLPASSFIYKKEKKLFSFERRFVHLNLNQISFRMFTDKMIEVFGDNAKVGLCFLLATLFKDVVIAQTRSFPILNLFGQKGSGKTELGHTLMSFFIIDNIPPNIHNATDASLADTIAQCSNSLVHLDEYKNSIDITRREFLKGLFDGTGRTRMNMDRDKKKETTDVKCGVILSGQEMPTIDNALFSRLIYLTFTRSEFTTAEKNSFNELTRLRKVGCSHLTIELLSHRKRFESEFPANYRSALDDIVSALEHENIEDRIMRSWVVPLAAFKTLEGVIDVDISYKELLKICINGIVRQNAETKSNNELSQFWRAVDIMHQQGVAIAGQDFRLEYEKNLRCNLHGKPISIEFKEPKAILYLNYELLLASYQRYAKGQGDLIVPTNTLKNYMEVSKEYLGKKQACRFQLISNPVEGSKIVQMGNGERKTIKSSKPCQAYCFDYAQISAAYGINLEIVGDTDFIDEKDIDTNNKHLPYE